MTFVNPSSLSRSLTTYCGAMQMTGFFASRIVVVSGGGLSPSAQSRVATLPNRAVEAPQHPANSKSRRFVYIGTSSKSPLTVALPGAEHRADVFCVDLKAPLARKIPRPRIKRTRHYRAPRTEFNPKPTTRCPKKLRKY